MFIFGSVIGEELDAFLQRHGKQFDRIIYVGDGSNDFCPILHLRRSVLSFLTLNNPLILSQIAAKTLSIAETIAASKSEFETKPKKKVSNVKSDIGVVLGKWKRCSTHSENSFLKL